MNDPTPAPSATPAAASTAPSASPAREPVTAHKHGGLGELPATAICGNDITSSCLYVSALAILQAGGWAWVSLLMVGAVLYLYRSIYAEVVGALPLNGGAYNALLNTTSKSMASVAACLTLLSYMATAVISASEAMHYVHSLWHGLPVISATIALLAVFMVLTMIGIGESSVAAIAIFLTHLATLSLLLVVGGVYLATHGGFELFRVNFAQPPPGGLGRALFFGFAAAMLGISGFESSSNFVEEQAEGVFPKTLRNMWVAVTFFNPAMAVLALSLIPIAEVGEHREALLAHLGEVAGGPWLATLVSVDAALVLSGAVLTSYVGVTGLVHRMALDRCLPQGLLVLNRRGTPHRIIGGFFVLSVSVLLLTQGDIGALAGVYTISFLSVMALFGVGNVLLKLRRARLPRPARASWPAVGLGVVAVLGGLAGNVMMSPEYFRVFLLYFVPTLLAVGLMLTRIALLKLAVGGALSVSRSLRHVAMGISRDLKRRIDEINSLQIVFFTRGDHIDNLNEAMLYVRKNEHTNRVKIVTVVADESEIPDGLPEDLEFLDRAYPEIDIEFVPLVGEHFGPELIQRLSAEWKIPVNFMFIGSPGDHFLYGLAELGGVRLVI